MYLRGERGAARSRALALSFRPLPRAVAPSIVITGFGVFPGAPRNATQEMIAAIARDAGIAMRRPSLRTPDFLVGRGAIGDAGVSLIVLPVLWDAAAMIVAKEARATRANVVVMCGIASKLSAITIEGFATSARRMLPDRFGVKPLFQRGAAHALETTFDTKRARDAAEAAIAREGLAMSVTERGIDEGNSYVCNATAHVAATLALRGVRVLRSSSMPEGVAAPRITASHGFVHWPADIPPERVDACARVLASMATSLIESRDAEAA
jgi:pyrrolidone-carboxylate peptidase